VSAAKGHTKTIDFLGTRPKASVDEVRQLREAENVLSSYSHATDLLAEGLQNATDAIDTRSEGEEDAPREIEIDFDVGARRFSVADSGTGISAENLEIVLTPNVTLKSGRLATTRTGRSRGEKGVGLSFLALASDFLHIRTCDGIDRHDLVVRNANRWVQSEGGTEKPIGELTKRKADELLGSKRYTSVTVEGVDPDAFDRDLFSLGKGELKWILRTATSVGNTAPLFSTLGREQPTPIEVRVRYQPGHKKKAKWEPIPYRYATPEELVPGLPVVDAAKLKNLSHKKIEARTQGKGVRYVERFETKSGYEVDLYVFIVHGVDMNRLLEERRERGAYIPDEWQSLEVATRDMPTGVPLRGGVIQPRALERRVFALFQYDELKLDLGRKTLAGTTASMFRDVLRTAWNEDLRAIIPHVGPAERKVSNVGKAALKGATREGVGRTDLLADLPYLKEPKETVGVMAVFHEVLGQGDGLPLLRTLRSGVFGETDSLVYVGNPNGEPPRHVLFAEDASKLVETLEDDEQRTETVNLAVLWKLDADYLDRQGIEYATVAGRNSGATHELALAGVGDMHNLEVIVLSETLDGNSG
jgi:hypothetical protein